MAKGPGLAVRKSLASALLVTTSLVILTVSTRSLVGVPEQLALTVLSTFQKGFTTVGVFFTDTAGSIVSLRRLQENYDELLKRVEDLGTLERSYSELKQENVRLREQLDYSIESNYTSTSARIIARDPSNLHLTFMINKGGLHGIRKNQAVVAFQDGFEGLIGRVVEVGRSSSMVAPIYDSTSFVAVRLERSRYDGLAVGLGSPDEPVLINYVKKRAKDEVQFGDMVVTSGLQSLYPPGIVVGRVRKVRDLDYLTSLELEMEPVIDFGRLEYVFVIGVHDDGSGDR